MPYKTTTRENDNNEFKEVKMHLSSTCEVCTGANYTLHPSSNWQLGLHLREPDKRHLSSVEIQLCTLCFCPIPHHFFLLLQQQRDLLPWKFHFHHHWGTVKVITPVSDGSQVAIPASPWLEKLKKNFWALPRPGTGKCHVYDLEKVGRHNACTLCMSCLKKKGDTSSQACRKSRPHNSLHVHHTHIMFNLLP